jgi:lipopolysaccharide/colanic/teichoic acid biosynthesis glycosyltransferase
MHFVGVMPRTLNDVQALPSDWKKLYLQSKAGLITLSQLEEGPHPSMDGLYAADAYYTVHMSWRSDCIICLRWIKKKICGLFSKK